MKYDVYSHWRDSARQPRLFLVDARAAVLILFFLMHPRWWTFITAISFIILLGILEYFKLTIVVAFRLLRRMVGGKRKIRLPRGHI